MIDSSEANLNGDLLESILAESVQLEPLSPEQGVDSYLNHREDELTTNTHGTHRSRLKFFKEWCEANEIHNLNDLSGRDLQEFRAWRKDSLNKNALASNLETLRVFLDWCVKYDAVRPDLPDKVDIPKVPESEQSRDEKVSAETANEILSHLDQYQYATTVHVCWLLLAGTGLRTSAIRALDLGDFERTEDGAILDLVHRPESDTGLKNQKRSQRKVFISSEIAEVIEDYVSEQRPEVTDDYGRQPLLASRGRLAASTIREYVYRWTRPCVLNKPCPKGYDEDEIADCEYRQNCHKAAKCPSASSPHTVRRGYITHELNAAVPDDVVGDRCDVTPAVMEKHYDQRDESDKLALRKEIRESAYQDSGKDEYYG